MDDIWFNYLLRLEPGPLGYLANAIHKFFRHQISAEEMQKALSRCFEAEDLETLKSMECKGYDWNLALHMLDVVINDWRMETTVSESNLTEACASPRSPCFSYSCWILYSYIKKLDKERCVKPRPLATKSLDTAIDLLADRFYWMNGLERDLDVLPLKKSASDSDLKGTSGFAK